MKTIGRFFNDEGAASAIEYSMIAGFISIVIVASVAYLAFTLSGNYNLILSVLH